MRIKEWIINLFNKVKLNSDKVITGADIKKKFPKIATFEATDKYYRTSHYWDMKDFLSTFLFRYLKYTAEKRDCDDYSAVLYGYTRACAGNYALGIVHVDTGNGLHALNFFVDENNDLWYIEPQTGELMKEGTYKVRRYKPYFVLV